MSHISLDLSSFTEGSDEQRLQFASDLLEELTHYGFVKIQGHGMRRSEVTKLFEWVRWLNAFNFFDGLSDEYLE